MATPSAAAVYARISSDPEGKALGVERQEDDCRLEAAQLGWSVAEVYIDNDVSAFSRKPRPAFERMLEDLRTGSRDAVICYHIDRLTRRNRDLDRFLEAVDEGKVRKVRFVTGSTDLGSGDGLLVARIMAAVAENESATKSRRIRRQNLQKAQKGLPHATSNRPFGYERDGVTIIESEAAIVRDLAARLLAGESMRALAVSLDEAGIKTVNGKTWRSPTVKGMLTSPRIAGLRSVNGEVVANAVWPAIISERDRERILHLLETRRQSGRRSPRRYLLTGMLKCGKCGNTLYSSARRGTRRYVCLSGPDHGGCGRLTVVAQPVEEWLAETVLYRLDTPELTNSLNGRTPIDEQTAALSRALADDQDQLVELAEHYGAKKVSMTEWLAAKAPIEARIRSAQQKIALASGDKALRQLLGTGDELRGKWSTLTLQQQAAIVRAVVDHAVISPGASGATEVDVDRIRPLWRV
jgi:DNA invertase Pin-like site-specific DNA recombinase